MPRSASNLPRFREVQLAFAAHLRDPDENTPPSGIEERRLAVYRELVYNNIERFLAGAFPVARSVLQRNDQWHGLVRAFVSRHGSESPYFLEISQEFLAFLADHDDPALPGFLLELCHYEWVELALAVADEVLPEDGIDPDGNLETGIPVRTPLLCKLGYRYPVHRIGPAFQPNQPEPHATELVVYRRRNDEVGFMEVKGLTMALLDALDGERSGGEVLQTLAASAPQLAPGNVYEAGLETLQRFRKADIVLGSRLLEPKR